MLQNDLEIAPKHLVETILVLCQNTNAGEDDQKILAFESLKPSHHPLIGI